MTEEYYRARAIEAQRHAEATTLTNVRDRCLRSAEAWEVMAQRVADTEARKKRNASNSASST